VKPRTKIGKIKKCAGVAVNKRNCEVISEA